MRRRWRSLHFRATADIAMDIVLIQRQGKNLTADAAKPIWLACLGEEMLPPSEIWPIYQRRLAIDHWNRLAFAKITLDVAQICHPRTRTTMERFDALVNLAIVAGA